jgi:DNA processing protein
LLYEKNILAVVGARKMTEYGRRVVRQIVGKLASAGVVIVSGLMYGIDLESHITALSNGGRTIAVLGYGTSFLSEVRFSQSVTDKLKTNKKDQVLIISEYPDNFHPTKWSFSKRNHIISSISSAVVVVEAAMESGSLITAGHALDQNKPVYSVPGSIFSTYSKGTNYLIQQGAEVLHETEDLIDYFKLELKCTNSNFHNPMPSKTKSLILGLIQESEAGCYFEELLYKLGIEQNSLVTNITELEINNIITRNLEGKYIIK